MAPVCRILTTLSYTVVPDMNAMSLRFLSGESDAEDFIYADEYGHFKTESANGKFNCSTRASAWKRTFSGLTKTPA